MPHQDKRMHVFVYDGCGEQASSVCCRFLGERTGRLPFAVALCTSTALPHAGGQRTRGIGHTQTCIHSFIRLQADQVCIPN